MAGKLDYGKLKDRREELDITQKNLSERTDINLSTIKAIETGRSSCDIETLTKITHELDIDIIDVYEENFHETKVISVVNNKGGSGKTSVTGSLGYALAEMGYRMLLIDADMQMSLSHSFNLDKNEKNLSVAILSENSLENYIIKTEYKNIDFIVSDLGMATIEMTLFTKIQRESILKHILKPIIDKGIYDFIIIDTNPTLAILNFNVLNASNFCIVPVNPDSFGVENIDIVLDFIESVKKFNIELKGVRILLNKYDIRTKKITKKCENYVRENYSDILLDTIIKIDTSLQNAQFDNKPVLVFDTSSRISKEYRELAKEIIKIVR